MIRSGATGFSLNTIPLVVTSGQAAVPQRLTLRSVFRDACKIELPSVTSIPLCELS